MSGVELYVYYRVARPDEAAALAEVRQLMRQLAQDVPGLEARLLRRGVLAGDGCAEVAERQAAAKPSTWMEIYRHPDGLDAHRLALIRRAALGVPSRCQGERIEEVFEPLGICDPTGRPGS